MFLHLRGIEHRAWALGMVLVGYGRGYLSTHSLLCTEVQGTGSFLYNTRSSNHYSSNFVYMRSVRRVSLTPPFTSAPECNRSLCWKMRTLPALGSTSNERCMSYEWNVVAPPSSLLAGVGSLR